ncbi:MAG: DNA (cytosine-5-)-methyltransferase [Oscillospiraceae bacterium]|nr:DNA (cytosine-5-)-methyltransferase [Oscillospiraceae bacterium]
MEISYKKLWKLLIDRDLKKKDLEERAGISHYTMKKLLVGENVTTEALGRISHALGCKIDEIMEITSEEEFSTQKKPTAISLFSGAGGMDVGFESAGFDIVFANEFDHDAAEAWRINRPDTAHVMIEGDIRDHIDDLSRYKDVDVVFGGPPCQGFSVAGKMDPNDERSQMVWMFMNAVDKVRPKVFVMENVAALGNLDKWKNVREGIVKRGNELGYDVTYKVHHTSDYGVPENRDRIIFVGVLRGLCYLEKFYKELVFFEAPPISAREVILSAGKFGSKSNPQTCTASVSLASHPVMRRSPYAGMLVNGAGRPINLNGIAPTLPASMGGNKTPIVDEVSLHDATIPNWFETYHAGLVSGIITPQETSVPATIRRLTIKECAAIQTFPTGYKFSGKKTKQYKQIGNAVPCRFAEAVATSVKKACLGGD